MKKQIEVKIREDIISMIRLTDDMVIITESEGDIQLAINEVDETLK